MIRDQLIRAFHDTHAFRQDHEQGFRLASGATSPYYVDCRLVLSKPAPRQLIAELAFSRLEHLEFSLIGGLEIGAIPLATCISSFAYLSTPSRAWETFVVRKQAKNHGLGKLIEGDISPGSHAVIVDDVMTTGGSLLKATDAARAAGLTVSHALVIVDRSDQHGQEFLRAHDLTLVSLLTLDDLSSPTP